MTHKISALLKEYYKDDHFQNFSVLRANFGLLETYKKRTGPEIGFKNLKIHNFDPIKIILKQFHQLINWSF